MTLVVAPASRAAMEFACERFHYAEKPPRGRLVVFGVWENDRFVGAVVFGKGAIPQIGDPYGLTQAEVCELVRVALDEHSTPTSKIVAVALRLLRKSSPGLRLVVSYADERAGHVGTLYQAMNWVYVGETGGGGWFEVAGETMHGRAVNHRYGTKSIPYLRANVDADARQIEAVTKHKYLYPFDREMRDLVELLRRPFPKRPADAVASS